MAVPLLASVPGAWLLIALALVLAPAVPTAMGSAGVVSGTGSQLVPWLHLRPYTPFSEGPMASVDHVHSVVPDQWFTRCSVAQDRRPPPEQQIEFDAVYLAHTAPSAFESNLDASTQPPTLKIVALANVSVQAAAVQNGSSIVSSISAHTHFGTFPISTQLTSLCEALTPTAPDPAHELAGQLQSCTYGPGTFGIGVDVPLRHLYPLGTIHTQIEVLSSGTPTLTLGCLELSLAQFTPSAWYWRLLLLLPIFLAVGFFVLAMCARPWAALTDPARLLWSEHGMASIASTTWGGYHVLSTAPLRQYLTPGLTDIWLVFQWAVLLAMVAVDWPEFVYTVLRQLMWTCLLVDVKLVQKLNQPGSIRYDPLALRSSLPEGDYAWAADQMTGNTSSPLYLGILSSSSNSDELNPWFHRQSIVNLSGAQQGIDALLRMARLHPQDGFGTCTTLFLVILAALVIVSTVVGAAHLTWLFCSYRSTGSRKGVHTTVSAEAPGGEAPRTRRGTPDMFKRRVQDVFDGHLAALQGNLIRMLILFHLPLTVMSTYQFSTYHDHTLAMAIVSFIIISLLAPLGALWHLRSIPADMGEDRAVLLALGPMYAPQSSPQVGLRVSQLHFLASLCTGIVVGAGQRSGTAQAIILFCFDILRAVLAFLSLARTRIDHKPSPTLVNGFNAVIYTCIRPLVGLLVLLLCPAVDLSPPVADWITWVLLIILGIVLACLTLLLLSKICQGVVRTLMAISFHRRDPPEPVNFLIGTGWGTVIGRLQARHDRGKHLFPFTPDSPRALSGRPPRPESCWTEKAHLLRDSFRSTCTSAELMLEQVGVAEDGTMKEWDKTAHRARAESALSFPSTTGRIRPLSSASFFFNIPRPTSTSSFLCLTQPPADTANPDPSTHIHNSTNTIREVSMDQDPVVTDSTNEGSTTVPATSGHNTPPPAITPIPLTVPSISPAPVPVPSTSSVSARDPAQTPTAPEELAGEPPMPSNSMRTLSTGQPPVLPTPTAIPTPMAIPTSTAILTLPPLASSASLPTDTPSPLATCALGIIAGAGPRPEGSDASIAQYPHADLVPPPTAATAAPSYPDARRGPLHGHWHSRSASALMSRHGARTPIQTSTPGGFVRVTGRKVSQSDPYGLHHAAPSTLVSCMSSSTNLVRPASHTPSVHPTSLRPARDTAPIGSSARAYLFPPSGSITAPTDRRAADDIEAEVGETTHRQHPVEARETVPHHVLLREEDVTPPPPPTGRAGRNDASAKPRRTSRSGFRRSFSLGSSTLSPTLEQDPEPLPDSSPSTQPQSTQPVPPESSSTAEPGSGSGSGKSRRRWSRRLSQILLPSVPGPSSPRNSNTDHGPDNAGLGRTKSLPLDRGSYSGPPPSAVTVHAAPPSGAAGTSTYGPVAVDGAAGQSGSSTFPYYYPQREENEQRRRRETLDVPAAVGLGRILGAGTSRQHVPMRKSPLAGKALNMSSLASSSASGSAHSGTTTSSPAASGTTTASSSGTVVRSQTSPRQTQDQSQLAHVMRISRVPVRHLYTEPAYPGADPEEDPGATTAGTLRAGAAPRTASAAQMPPVPVVQVTGLRSTHDADPRATATSTTPPPRSRPSSAADMYAPPPPRLD